MPDKTNMEFMSWVKSGVFTMTLTVNHCQAFSHVLNAALRKEDYEYDWMQSGIRNSLFNKGLFAHYNKDLKGGTRIGDKGQKIHSFDRSILAIRLTFAGRLTAGLLSEARMIEQDLYAVMDAYDWMQKRAEYTHELDDEKPMPHDANTRLEAVLSL